VPDLERLLSACTEPAGSKRRQMILLYGCHMHIQAQKSDKHWSHRLPRVEGAEHWGGHTLHVHGTPEQWCYMTILSNL
jgi:hypothetical protein